jgi:hypothetical protein
MGGRRGQRGSSVPPSFRNVQLGTLLWMDGPGALAHSGSGTAISADVAINTIVCSRKRGNK